MNEEMPSREQVSIFLKAKWSNRHCEVCGVENWNLAGSDDWPNSAFMAVSKENNTPGPFWPVGLLVCGNCQNTKAFFLLGVQAWLSSEEGKTSLNLENHNLWDGMETGGE